MQRFRAVYCAWLFGWTQALIASVYLKLWVHLTTPHLLSFSVSACAIGRTTLPLSLSFLQTLSVKNAVCTVFILRKSTSVKRQSDDSLMSMPKHSRTHTSEKETWKERKNVCCSWFGRMLGCTFFFFFLKRLSLCFVWLKLCAESFRKPAACPVWWQSVTMIVYDCTVQRVGVCACVRVWMSPLLPCCMFQSQEDNREKEAAPPSRENGSPVSALPSSRLCQHVSCHFDECHRMSLSFLQKCRLPWHPWPLTPAPLTPLT